MAKIHDLQVKSQRRGVIIGSAWANSKGGFGIRLKGKVKNDKGELIDMEGKDLISLKFGDSLLMVPNNRKREGKKDPDFIVFAYPDEQKEK